MAECPICERRTVLPRPQNPAFPFCSTRCKQVDLGKWLDEKYRIAAPPASQEESEPREQLVEEDA